MSLVIDASVALAWVFGDEHHDAAWQIVDRLLEEPAWVPAHFHLEVGNGLLSGLVGMGPGWAVTANATRGEAAQVLYNLLLRLD